MIYFVLRYHKKRVRSFINLCYIDLCFHRLATISALSQLGNFGLRLLHINI